MAPCGPEACRHLRGPNCAEATRKKSSVTNTIAHANNDASDIYPGVTYAVNETVQNRGFTLIGSRADGQMDAGAGCRRRCLRTSWETFIIRRKGAMRVVIWLTVPAM
jgi:hypothetical protein